ncbi:hypothetical protein M1O20_03225 [Dehalococcoidia bacterium]|nr:hypothetical protein [Dehalococcoidia bacterium]MCL0059487.1 hypothetical protein [Dehalococcoidia bacterium]
MKLLSRKLIFPSVLVAILVAMATYAVFAWDANAWDVTLMVLIFPGIPLLAAAAIYTVGVTMKRPSIKVAAAVLGVFGGVIGMGYILEPLFIPLPPVEAVLGTLAFLMAIGGAVLTLARPRVGGILMLLASIVEWSGFGAHLYTTLFLVPGGALALASEKKRPAAIYVAMALGIIGGLSAGVAPLTALSVLVWKQGIEELLFWTWVLLFPGMGVLGGILVLEKPKVAARLMFISAISGPVGLYAVGWIAEAGEVGAVFAGVTCFLLVIAATIAFRAYPKSR